MGQSKNGGPPTAPAHEFVRTFGLFDATLFVVGSMIGSGVFIVAAEIARQTGSAGGLLLTFVITGILTIAAALCYGELAALFPHAGGQYVYLREAYSPLWGFLYGWTLFLVIQTGTIAAVAVGFSRYLGVLWPALSPTAWIVPPIAISSSYAISLSLQQLVAALMIVALTLINMRGVRLGKLIQNTFAVAKVATLIGMILAGILIGSNADAIRANFTDLFAVTGAQPIAPGASFFRDIIPTVTAAAGGLGLLVALCVAQAGSLFTADAWNNIGFTAAELRHPTRDVPRAMILGTIITITLFCLINLAYLCTLPIAAIQTAPHDRVASAVFDHIFGPAGATIVAVGIVIATVGCNNGMLLSGARVYYAMARDGLFFRSVGRLNAKGVPAVALLCQAAWTVLLLMLRTRHVSPSGEIAYGDIYTDLLNYVVVSVLLFYVLSVIGIFVLRRTRPDAERGYRVVGYPVLPLVYIGATLLIMTTLVLYRTHTTWPGLVIVGLGVPVYGIWRQGLKEKRDMVRRRRALAIVLLPLLLAGSTTAFAQTEATVVGVVTDESNAVLPGVTVTATDVASGRQYVGISNDRGEYRLPSVLPGTYRIQAELASFATVVVERVELLVGQHANLPFKLTAAALSETVTVTGAGLVNTQTFDVSGNIDRRQMEALPIQGRNWMELSLMVKGVTANDVGANRPVPRDDLFQLSLDGQQITQGVASSNSSGQPRLSREAIAEYQVLSNVYDVTMGRSVGLQIQAISRSGTNDLSGSVYGHFRDDALNAKDFVARRVLPYSNQQTGFSLGGPIVKDKLQYFGTYEYEREPSTLLMTPPALSGQSLAMPRTITQHSILGRGDYQMNPQNRLAVRGTYSSFKNPFSQAIGTDYPTNASNDWRYSAIVTANWTRVLSGSAVSELKVGYYYYYWKYALPEGVPGVPFYSFPGFGVASKSFNPQLFWQKMPSVRYDMSLQRGTHGFKIGAEYLHRLDAGNYPTNARGTFVFSTLPADIARRFPIDAWDDPTRWDLAGLDTNVLRFTRSYATDFGIHIPRKTSALWIADTWRMTNQLTLNLGVRYDLDWGAYDPPGPGGSEFRDATLLISNGFDPANTDFGYKTGIRDFTNVSPRAGVTFKVSYRLVLRGGAGLFYGAQESNLTFGVQQFNGQNVVGAQFDRDGRPNFIQDPTRGRTAEDILSGNGPLPPQDVRRIAPDYQTPRTFQSNVGVQTQIVDGLGFDADLVYTRGSHLGMQRDVNLFYDPVTGYNLNPVTFGRPRPDYGTVLQYESTARSEQLFLATSVTRRFRDRWQGGLAYTLAFFNDDEGTHFIGYASNVDNYFCISCEYGRSTAYQRHTLRLNGIVDGPWGVSLSGTYSFGSGAHFVTSYPANPFGISGGVFGLNRFNSGAPVTIPESIQFQGRTIDVRDRFEGPDVIPSRGVVPKNALRGLALSKLDVRLSREVPVPATGLRLTGMFEVFNVLNHANYGNYNGLVNSPTFGAPVQNANLAYQPRVIQVGFRAAF